MLKAASLGVSLFIAALAIGPAVSFAADTRTCANGSTSHAATPAEAASANAGGIIAGVTQLCPEDAALGINADVGGAKTYLNSLPKKCVGACAAPPDKAHIDKLDDSFAICAANFFKAYTSKVGSVFISSAYRDGPSGENARANGAPNSNHTKGLAIDVSPANGDFPTMWDFAKKNPQLGICFPYLGGDRPHMTLAGSGTGEAARCASQGIARPCAGSNFDPSAVKDPGPTLAQITQGAAGITQSLGNMFAPPQPQCPPGYIRLNGTCLPPQPSTATQMQSPLSYASPPPTTLGTDNLNTNTNINSNGSSANVSGLIDSTGNPKPGTSMSAYDLIKAIVNPTTTPANIAATGTPLVLSNNLSNTVSLHGNDATLQSASTSTTYTLNPGVPQTFVSEDLSKSPTSLSAVMPVNSTFAVLENLKQVLLSVLAYLKPFGGSVHTTPVQNATTAYME